MIARILTLMAACTIACSNGTGPNGNAPACVAPTAVFSGLDSYDSLVVQNGFVYVEIPGEGVARCATTGCTAPTTVIDNDAFISSAFDGTSFAYTTQIASADSNGVTGEIRSVATDGTGDQSVLEGATYPAYVALSGTKTFWADDSFTVDDTPATINCVGCSGSTSTPWFAGLTGGTYGMLADGNNVYVLADDPTLTSVTLYACSINTPCYSEPRLVIGQLDSTITAQQIASDGTNVYVARSTIGDIVRVDAAGTVTRIAAADAVSALVYDATTNTVYYGTSAGLVSSVKADGSAQPAALGCSSASVAALDVDAMNVYLLTGDSQSDVMKIAK